MGSLVFLVIFVFAVIVLSMISWLFECISLVTSKSKKMPKPLAWICLLSYVTLVVLIIVRIAIAMKGG